MRKRYIIRHGKRIEVETITPAAPRRRKVTKLAETWAQIPHHRGLQLAKEVGNPVLAVLLALEAAIHKERSNQVELSNDLLRMYKIRRQAKTEGLRQLAAAGVVSVEWRDRKAPTVTHRWYTSSGVLRSK
jgi:hypothetical protein